jgi:cobalt/nickel transport system ATP-binding protein
VKEIIPSDEPDFTSLEFAIDNAHFSYERVAALQGLTLEIRAGERIALLGANGSGKSTLLRLMDGLVFPSRGTVCFRGSALTEDALENDVFSHSFRRRVGLVFQNPDTQLFNPTVFDEVAFGPLQLGWNREEILERVHDTLAWIGAEHLKDRAPYRLSGGEKKRVAIASVIILDPDVLLLDEPTAALDPRSQNQIIELLESWNNGTKTIISATHQLDILSEVAERAVVIEHGAVVADATPAELLEDIELLEAANLIQRRRHTPHLPAHISL